MNRRLTNKIEVLHRDTDALHQNFVDKLNISVTGLYVLDALYQQNRQHASELARAVGREVTGFTPVLDKLESLGLITREPDPQDRRAVIIALTVKAEGLRKDIVKHMEYVDGELTTLLLARVPQPVNASRFMKDFFEPIPAAEPF